MIVLLRGGGGRGAGTTTALLLSRATTTTPSCTTTLSKTAAASTKARARLPQTTLAATTSNNNNEQQNNEESDNKHRKQQDVTAVTKNTPSTSTTTTTTSSSRNNVLVTAALSAIALVSILAKLDVLPGPLLSKVATTAAAAAHPTNSYYYTDRMWQQDVTVTVLTATLGYAFVQVISTATDHGWLAPNDSRKTIHTLSAPLFMLFWPAFSPAPVACWMAAVVPLCNALRLVRAATSAGGKNEESSLAAAVSRSGATQEALGGPFIYVLWLTTVVITTWRTSPVGIVALSTMAAGDGLADLCGRRWGANNSWPFLRNNKKSVAGSCAFWVAATFTSVALLAWMQYWGCFTLAAESWSDVTGKVALITLVAAIVELIPIADDNYTVPFVAAVGTWWLLPVA